METTETAASVSGIDTATVITHVNSLQSDVVAIGGAVIGITLALAGLALVIKLLRKS